MKTVELLLTIIFLLGATSFSIYFVIKNNWSISLIVPTIILGLATIRYIVELIIGLCIKDNHNIITKDKTDWIELNEKEHQ